MNTVKQRLFTHLIYLNKNDKLADLIKEKVRFFIDVSHLGV
jgi:hypothetical protein